VDTYGGERPAGTALALILDVGHVALGPPVDVLVPEIAPEDGGHVVHGADSLLEHGGAEAVELRSDLVAVHVGELVDGDGEGHLSGLVAGVVLGDLDGILLEDLHAVGLLN